LCRVLVEANGTLGGGGHFCEGDSFSAGPGRSIFTGGSCSCSADGCGGSGGCDAS
jgi:hypothetical protein